MQGRIGRLTLVGLVVAWFGASIAEAGDRNSACGGPLQRHCCALPPETNNLLPCDGGRVTAFFGPGVDGGPFGCSLGTCYSTSFPAACGGRDEPACAQSQHYQECQSGFRNSAGVCRHTDDLFPAGCGHEDQAACNVIVQLALGINSCQSFLREVPFPGGQCIRLDDDGFPPSCGGLNERPCTIFEHIPSCKAALTEVLEFGGGGLSLRCVDLLPDDCGRNGQRPCTIFEHLTGPCAAGLSIRTGDFGECGADPMTWPATEVPRGGPRTVFLIHGRGGDFSELDLLVGDLSHELKFQVPNVRQVYGLDWNARYSTPRKVTVRELVGDLANDPSCDRLPHTCDFPERTDTNGDGVIDEQDADPKGKCSGGPKKDDECRSDGGCRIACYGGPEPGRPEAGRSCSITPCNVAITDEGGFGDVEFDTTDFEIWEVARGMSEAIKALPSTPEVTIVTGSFGAAIARHLVYRHYDELRLAGKRIAEVVTLGSPHQGGHAATPDIDRGAELQNLFACLGTEILNPGGHLGCEIGRWIEWSQGRAAGDVPPFTPFPVDDRSFPQIRWIVAAAGGRTLDLGSNISALQGNVFALAHPDAGAFLSLMSSLQDPRENFHDSDGTITVRSAFGIQPDECYPFTRDTAPSGGPGPEIVNITRSYNVMHYDQNGDGAFTAEDEPIGTCRRTVPDEPVIQLVHAASAVCHHPGARLDPRVAERDELTCLNHADFWSDGGAAGRDVRAFVVAALSLAGDTNGDGVVNALDHPITPDAGPDQTLECTGPATAVVLDGSGSAHVLARPLTYGWAGDFGGATGVAPTLSLAVGTHAITLTVDDGAGATESDGVTVTVQDTTPPAIEGASAFFLEATAVTGTSFAFAPAASDLCGPVTFDVSPQLDVYPLGTTVLTVTATDPSGNSAGGFVQVAVADTTPPVIVAPPGVTAEANAALSTVAIGTASATDIFPVTVVSNARAAYPLGLTVVSWTATDANGNSAGAAQTVRVVDTTPPVLALPPDVVVTAVGALTPIEIGTATATDIFGATVSHDAPARFPLGSTVVNWTAIDGNGNRASATQTVHVIYRFEGFAGPIQPGGVYKANRNLPLKFSLSFADGTAATAAIARLSVVPLGADGSSGEPLDVEAGGSADGGDLFCYTGHHYQFNLKTKGWSAGRYRLTVSLDDGQAHAMEIASR